MQLAHDVDPTVQHYIDALLSEGKAGEAGEPASADAAGGAQPEQAFLQSMSAPATGALSAAVAAIQPATDVPTPLAGAIAAVSALSVPSPAQPGDSCVSDGDASASDGDASASVGVGRGVGVVAVNADQPLADAQPASDVDRGAAFVKHLQAAQALTAQRLTGLAGQVTRPRALAQAPAWVEAEQLVCLAFKVANLKLALPVQYLEGVEPFPGLSALGDDQLAVLPEWQNSFVDCCLGELAGRVVLDTARLVMPERYNAAMADNYRQVLRVRDMDWCFAVDSIGGEMPLRVGEVRWRSQHTRREWLAGTVIDKMCAIVDVDALHRLLLAASVLGDDEPGEGA